MAIGSTAIMAAGSVVGGLAQASAAKKAAQAQENAAQEDIAFQKETRDLVFDRLDPFYQGGTNAFRALLSEMGLADAPTIGGNALAIETIPGTPGTTPSNAQSRLDFLRGSRDPGDGPDDIRREMREVKAAQGATAGTPTQYRVGDKTFYDLDEAKAYAQDNATGGREWGGFEASPGYQFRLEQGQDAVNALAGAQGGLNSGRTLQAMSDYNQNAASAEYGNWFNRLAGMAGYGLSAGSGQAAAAQNTAQGVSNALAGIGNAKAAGAIGVGNAINSSINNGIGIWAYQNGLNNPNSGLTVGGGGR